MLVSICCITYNHGKYIAEALEGFLVQKTTFPIEIIIHDDASTDNTTSIIKEYAIKYPELVFPIFQNENQYSKGINPGFEFVLPKCNGKYIATCEGDDYWTDPNKLQKQVDFLEANPEYSLCFHDVKVIWENNSIPSYNFCDELKKSDYDIFDIIKKWFIPTASMVFRMQDIVPVPKWISEIKMGDYALQLLCGMQGKIKYINQEMAVYRRTIGTDSMTSRYNTMDNLNGLIKLFTLFNIHSKKIYSKSINRRIRGLKFERYILSQKYKHPCIWSFFKRAKNHLKS